MKKKKAKARRRASRTPAAHFPKGWNQKRADEVARYYDNQSDEEAIAEAEAAYNAEGFAMIQVPIKLVPEVQKLLARRADDKPAYLIPRPLPRTGRYASGRHAQGFEMDFR